MNERIRELKQQSIDYVDGYDDGLKLDHYQQEVDNKFAELIIKECAEVYRIMAKPDRPLYPTEFSAALIKHFDLDTVRRNILAGAEIHSDKGYEECTLEEAMEFARKRNERTN